MAMEAIMRFSRRNRTAGEKQLFMVDDTTEGKVSSNMASPSQKQTQAEKQGVRMTKKKRKKKRLLLSLDCERGGYYIYRTNSEVKNVYDFLRWILSFFSWNFRFFSRFF